MCSRDRAKSFVTSVSLHLVFLLCLSWFFVSSRVRQTVSLTASTGSEQTTQTFLLTPEIADPPEVNPLDESAYEVDLLHSPMLLTSLQSQDFKPKIERVSVDFFGSQAYGNRFVFILDISTSMNARDHDRISRARDELIRSVSALSPQQSYYVFLFCWETIHMYGAGSSNFVHAEGGHLQRLRYWLNKTKLGGGTDPRRALVLAHEMKPDAIFLLSDGQFNRRDRGRAGWANKEGIPVGASVPDGVKAALDDIPIHTIAFENPFTRETMQSIAEASGGGSRYVKTRSLEPINRRLLIQQLQYIRQSRDGRWQGDEGKNAIRLYAAKTLIEDGELAFAEFVAREIRDFQFTAVANRRIASELFEILDDELGEVRLEDFQNVSIADIEGEVAKRLKGGRR